MGCVGLDGFILTGRVVASSLLTLLFGHPSPPVIRLEGLDEIGCVWGAVEKVRREPLRPPQGIHHRHPLQSVLSGFKDQRVPVGRNDRIAVLLHAAAAEPGTSALRWIDGGRPYLFGGEHRAHATRRDQVSVQAPHLIDVVILQVEHPQFRRQP